MRVYFYCCTVAGILSQMNTPTPETATTIRNNWQAVQAAVHKACLQSGRTPAEVTIVGVTKYVDAPFVEQLVQAGCSVLGENRPQSLWDKWDYFSVEGRVQPTWHMIGHFQRNKVRRSLSMLSLIHSIDSDRLAEEFSKEAASQNLTIPILIDVNMTDDTTKTGMQTAEVRPLIDRILDLPNIALRGLMTMSTHHGGSDQVRRDFASVREFRDSLQSDYGSQILLQELSMGMSGDFSEAIAEGATIVRIGSSLWEGIV